MNGWMNKNVFGSNKPFLLLSKQRLGSGCFLTFF